MEKKLIIKQIVNPDNPEIGIKYPGAKEYATPKVGRDGKLITGIDEFSMDIVNLPPEDSKKEIAKVKKIRENLEKVLGVKLETDSNYWDDFVFVLEDETILDSTNALHQLLEKFLVANFYVAPSLEDIKHDERYAACLFYMFREEEEMGRTAKKKIDKDKAIGRLFNLNEDNPTKLKMVAAYVFGFDAKVDLSPDEAYVKLSDYIEVEDDDQQKKNIKLFLEACQKSPEQLGIKQIFDKAIKKKLISGRGGIYKRGVDIYGNSYDEALDYLSLPSSSSEVADLIKAVE